MTGQINSAGMRISLPFSKSRRIAEAYSRGILMLDALPEYLEVFQGLFEKIRGITYPARGNE
jgi:hypothetical protein